MQLNWAADFMSIAASLVSYSRSICYYTTVHASFFFDFIPKEILIS